MSAGQTDAGASRSRTLLDFAVSKSPALLYSGRIASPCAVQFVSANADSVVGWPADDLIGPASIWRNLVHPNDQAGYAQAIEQLLAEGVVVHEYRLRTASGQYVWVRDQQRLTDPHDDAGSESGNEMQSEYVGCVTDITKEKAAEADLNRANAINRAIVDASVDAVITMDCDGLVIEFNPAAELMLGYSAREAKGMLLCDLMLTEENYARGKKSFERYRKGEASSDIGERFETEARRRNNTRFPAEVRMRRVEVDETTFVVAEIRDLSERVEAEAAHRRLMQLLHEAVESLPAGFAISDAQERVVLCNRAFAEPYDSTPDELIGMSRQELVAKLYPNVRSFNGISTNGLQGYVKAVTDRLGNPTSGPSEVELANGEWRLVSAFPTTDGGVVTIRTDITKLKQAEEAVRESESTIRLAVEACPVPLGLVRAADGLIIYESPAAQQLFGRTETGDQSYTTGYFVRREDRKAFLERLYAGGTNGFEALMRRANGDEFWASISARLIEFMGEETVVTSVYDLTERRAIDEEIARQREALHQSEKLAALGELLASVAHELNNPLSVVVGQALLLKETATDKAIADRAEKIGSAADRCSRIVRTFLAMARQQPMERRPVDLNRVVELSMEVTAYSLRAADIDIRLSLSPDLPPIWGDADQLNQVLTNLILNAQKALEDSKGRRRIKIITSYRERTREVVLKIKDNGPGIPENIRSRIFEPFFTTRQVGSGTGIGLAFCHRIITTHGGSIEVDSGIDGGANFIIRMPVTRMNRAVTDPVEPGAQAAPAASILVVDDEVAVAEMMADILEDEGHEVEIAHSGSQALDVIATRQFDLVLSDLRMPDLDGPAMFDAIRETRPDLVARIAFITGDTMSTRIRDFLQVSERPYIEKPITPQDVRDLVRQMLHESKTSIEELDQ